MVKVVGIDSAKDRVDAVLFNGSVIDCMSVDLSKPKPPLRDQSLKRMHFDLISWLRHTPIDAIYVEDAIMMRNARVAIWLAQTVGMILTLPYPVFAVPIDTWKQELCKAGASKERVREVVSGRHPETADLFGDRQDLFDATGVAIYGATDQLLRTRPTASSNPAGSQLA